MVGDGRRIRNSRDNRRFQREPLRFGSIISGRFHYFVMETRKLSCMYWHIRRRTFSNKYFMCSSWGGGGLLRAKKFTPLLFCVNYIHESSRRDAHAALETTVFLHGHRLSTPRMQGASQIHLLQGLESKWFSIFGA